MFYRNKPRKGMSELGEQLGGAQRGSFRKKRLKLQPRVKYSSIKKPRELGRIPLSLFSVLLNAVVIAALQD